MNFIKLLPAIVLALILAECKEPSHKDPLDAITKHRDTTKAVHDTSADHISYTDYETLVETGDSLIPGVLKKFTPAHDSLTTFGGRGTSLVVTGRHWKILCLKLHSKEMTYNTLISYDSVGHYIDMRCFPFYCPACSPGIWLTDYYFDKKNKSIFYVDYYHASHMEQEPNLKYEKIKRKDTWAISQEGKFIFKVPIRD